MWIKNMNKIDKKLDVSAQNGKSKYLNDWKLEVCALIGFCFSGVVFILSGIKNGDILTIIGSSVWMVSCVIWMIPYRKYLRHPEPKKKNKS